MTEFQSFVSPLTWVIRKTKSVAKGRVNTKLLCTDFFNVNTTNRLHFRCPEGMKPSVDYVTCKRTYDDNNPGQWKFPADVREHGIVCLKADEKNPFVIQQCKDLKEKYYDETVNASFF